MKDRNTVPNSVRFTFSLGVAALLLAPAAATRAEAPAPGRTAVALVAEAPRAPSPVAAPAAPVSAPAAANPAASPSAAEAPSGPLDAAWTQAFSHMPQDPLPPELVRNTHYVVSNEDRHDVFRSQLIGRGGVFVGVGSDQNYVMAGWARPELLVLMDFDQVVVNLHRVYRLFFLQAKDVTEFMSLWAERNEKQVVALIEAAHPEPQVRAGLFQAYRIARYSVMRRLKFVHTVYAVHNVQSFVDDPEQFRFIQDLYKQNRVVILRGDLTKGGALTGIANAASSVGAKIRVLYLSNAERYFTYTDGFKKSMLALPMDDRSLVLRTRARLNGSYEYILQEGSNFQSWMRSGRVGQAIQLTRWREINPDGLTYTIHRLPVENPGQAKAPSEKPPKPSAG